MDIVVVSGHIEATERQILRHLGAEHFVRKGAHVTRRLGSILRDLERRPR